VSIITRQDIDRTGASNVQELIDRLTANNGGGRALGESIGESSAPGQSGASLRGLGRDRTLLLLNGRRLATYPFQGSGVDLNAIPLAAIQRIEVLRDGASATYGSDAIAGVINFITRKDLQGGEIAINYERPEMAGGRTTSVSGGFGFGDLSQKGWNVLGTFNYQEYTVIKSSDRDYAKTGIRPDLGIVKDSGNTFPANATIPKSGTTASQYVPGAAGFPTCAPPESFKGSANCRYDFTSKIDLYPESKRYGGIMRGTMQLDSANQLFAEGMYSKNEMIFGLSQTPSVTTGKPAYVYPGGGKWYPTAAVDAVRPGYRGDLTISWRMVDGGQRRQGANNDSTRVVLGAEGTLASWDYKAGVFSTEVNAETTFLSGQYSDARLKTALLTGLVNPFGANDAAGLAELEKAALTGSERKSKTTNKGFDAQVSHDIFTLPAGPVAIGLGGEFRKETYLDGYSDLAASGDIVGGSGTAGAVSGSRTSTGIFAELQVPVVKNLDVTLSLRRDSYTKTSGSSRDGSFDSPDLSATSPKVSLRFQPIPEILVRASFGKGFRVPTLNDFYSPSSFTNTGGNFTDPFYNNINKTATQSGCVASPDTNYCDTQLTAQNNSNPSLKPEKSEQYNLGLVLEPIKGLVAEISYFNIKITDGIIALSGDDVMKDWYANQTGPTTSSSVYANRLIKDGETGYLNYIRASLENIGEFRVSGFDASAKYTFRTSMGNFTPSWDATFLTKFTQTNVVSGDLTDYLGKYARGGPAIKQKHKVGLDYESGPWSLSGRYDWQGSYEDYSGTRTVKSYELVDAQTSYRGIKNLTLTLGVRNLFNKTPPASDQQDYFQVGFDPTYADVKGRRLYVGANYKF
jgi:iron complex outermembrane receptor protein